MYTGVVNMGMRPMKTGSRNCKIGFTCGAFDLLHAGHMLMLEDARKQCDYLIVGLQVDPSYDRPAKHGPVQSWAERYTMLKGIKYVDEVVTYGGESELVQLLKRLKVDLCIRGSDKKGLPYAGDELDIDIYYHERNHEYSTTELRRRVASAENARPSTLLNLAP